MLWRQIDTPLPFSNARLAIRICQRTVDDGRALLSVM